MYAGTAKTRRDEVLEELNSDYAKCIAGVKTIQEAYDFMVSTKSYRLLSRFTYDLVPQLLRSNRLGGPPNETCLLYTSPSPRD